MFDDATLLKIIEQYDSIVIFGHKLPDPDCYGCQVGLREIIREKYPNKNVFIVGSGVVSLLPFLGNLDKISQEVYSNSLGILVDASGLCRSEDPNIKLCKYWIKFDHHRHNEEETFDFPHLVDEECISCAEIIYDFAVRNNLVVNKLAAQAFYCAMLADSGNFKYYGTTAHTLDVASELLKKFDNAKQLYDAVFYVDEETKRIRSYISERVKVDGQVAYADISKKEYDSQKVSYEKASGSVNAVGCVSSSNIFMLMTETPYGKIRVELRSNKMFPVNQVALDFGGGGHKFASGCEINNIPEEKRRLLDALNKVEKVV